ncbi:MAG: hypothetical protein DWQ44_06645 [Bacteroidetes bacterium]|nr:MAG: hypothetical protein DWQ33_03115 [Bacteroidota bacterium]REK00976.1 MAG: hypothetical protein DWQ39_10410 [Bacteroidota bacterium]REK34579.1 MAG: hypothetical protein DWQ44_06645 [Bacteroidota bacterium]REK51838.1 MAG: hypothetical protein DWQ48_00245 [Bacteroidota bacterium]
MVIKTDIHCSCVCGDFTKYLLEDVASFPPWAILILNANNTKAPRSIIGFMVSSFFKGFIDKKIHYYSKLRIKLGFEMKSLNIQIGRIAEKK